MNDDRVICLEDVTIFSSPTSGHNRYYKDNIILRDVCLDVYPGELVYLIGKVGSGKSSLLKTLYAELPMRKGRGFIGDFTLHNLHPNNISKLRRSLGLVFQDFQLLPDRTVYENLKFFLRALGWKNIAAINKRIDETLSIIDLRGKAHAMPHQLSGGEQQRLSVGRAFLNRPEIILADEPTGNLDPISSEEIMELFTELVDMGCSVIVATHNISLIEKYPSRTLRFNDGIVEEIDIVSILGLEK